MKRDSIEFENEKVSVLFRKLLIPTFIGSIAIRTLRYYPDSYLEKGRERAEMCLFLLFIQII